MTELREELARLLLASMQAIPPQVPIGPSLTDLQVTRAAFNQVYDEQPMQGGPKVHPPEDRQRIREAEAKAKDAHQAARQAQAAQAPAQPAPTPPPPRKRGRPPTAAAKAPEPGADLSGDPEEGNHTYNPDDAPGDPPQPPPETPARTPAQMRDLLLTPLRQVHAKDPKAAAVLCQRYGAPRISRIADEHVDALWNDVRELCLKHDVPFTEDDPDTGELVS